MATEERIKQLLDCAVKAPVKDAAGVYIPGGMDATVRAKAIADCLKIVQDEKMKGTEWPPGCILG